MKIIQLIVAIAKLIPAIGLNSKAEKEIKKLGYGINDNSYTGAALVTSLLITVFLIPITFLMFANVALALIFVVFALVFYFLLSLPGIEVNQKTKDMEAELPLVLSTMSIFLTLRLPFEHVLEIVATEKNTVGDELKKIIIEMKKGVTLQNAVSRFALNYPSVNLKRAFSQIISAYEIGSGKELGRIANELLSIQQHKLKEYSSKGALFGLLFIMVSAVLPTFFLLYSVLGNYLLEENNGKIGVITGMLVLFPLISFILLIFAKANAPRTLFEDKEKYSMFIFIPLVIFIGSFLLPVEFTVVGLIVGYVLITYNAYREYKKERRIEEIEKNLPDALLSVSALPESTTMEKMFETIEFGDYGILSEESRKTRKQLSAGVSVTSALGDLETRNNSQVLRRTVMMLEHTYYCKGMNRLNRFAEDILQFLELKREKYSLLAMQKYTLLLGGLLVPTILKITINLLKNLMEFFDGNMEILTFASSLVPAYICIYAFMAAIYISEIEGKKSNISQYFLMISLVGLLAFTFISFS